jgi:glycosyltransferase involved in cell wall biosynthesis
VLASVTPTETDNIPTVLMEAGATGLPLVSTEVAGIPELVRHGQTGWLIPSGDPNALADAIAVLAADPALRARLGQNARTLVEAEFSTQDNVLRLADVFCKTCQEWLGGGDTTPPARKT